MQWRFFSSCRLFRSLSGSFRSPPARLCLFLLISLALVACRPVSPAPSEAPSATYWPSTEWRTAAPEEHGIDSARLAEALLTMREQGVDIHSLLIVRDGEVLVDAAFYPYDGKTVHEVASVTKSVMTTLIGIAVDQGKLRLDDPMLAFFPDRTVANRDARKEAITVRHLVSMSSGLDCVAEGDEQTLGEMRVTDDWVQFALDRPVRWEPGAQFVYCSPAIHLLSPILQQATGMTALDFARRYLFDPLGITEVQWLTDPQGFFRGSEGLYLHPQDMAKLGYLWLHEGVWAGEQIVARQWVQDSVGELLPAGEDSAYGYGWWVEPAASSYSAEGRGGQHIGVIPALGILLVTTGGGFDLDEIDPLLLRAIVDLENPLPPNAEGAAALAAATAAVGAPPVAQVQPLPALAQAISGQTYVFAANPASMESARLDFADAAEATLHIKLAGQPLQTWPVGLDGVHRLSPGRFDLPQGLRGHWEDEQTFLLEYDNIANNDHSFLRFRFVDDGVMVTMQETAHELGASFAGQASR